MTTYWTGQQLLADRATLAAALNVSERTIRRRCTPVTYQDQTGLPRGLCGLALYDAEAAAALLADVTPRTRAR